MLISDKREMQTDSMGKPSANASTNVKIGVNLIAASVIDSVIDDLKHLKLNQESYQSIVHLLESKKESDMLDVKKKRRSTKKREIADEHQCRHVNNEDKRCGAPMCDKKLQRCWVHMTAEQQTKYQANKNKKK